MSGTDADAISRACFTSWGWDGHVELVVSTIHMRSNTSSVGFRLQEFAPPDVFKAVVRPLSHNDRCVHPQDSHSHVPNLKIICRMAKNAVLCPEQSSLLEMSFGSRTKPTCELSGVTLLVI